MATESGGNILGGLVGISGPENLIHEGIMAAIQGSPSQANTREHLIQYGGPLGVLTVAEQQASRLAGKAFDEWAKENRRRARKGLPELPMPPQASYAYGGQLARAGTIYQAAPQQPPTQTPGPPASVGGFLAGIDWQRAINTGTQIAELVAYFRDLFGNRRGDTVSGYGIFPGERPGDSRSPYQTVIGGNATMPYNFMPSPSMSGAGFDIGGALSGIGSIISAVRGGQSSQMPGGAMALGNYGGLQGIVPRFGAALDSMTAGGSTCRIGSVVGVTNPNTGKMVWLRKAGVPLLWSGDVAACKRVRKVKGGGRRRSGGC